MADTLPASQSYETVSDVPVVLGKFMSPVTKPEGVRDISRLS